MVHLAAAPHGICWEHGVVVELDTASAGVRATPAPEGLAPAMVPVVRSDQHPHCPALWVFRQGRVEAPGAAPVPGSLDLLAVVSSSHDVPPRTGWALRRAPKQSPPV